MQVKSVKWAVLSAVLSLSSGYACVYGQQPWSGILAPSRAVNWSNAGVSGGIPSASWKQCGSTIAPFGSSASPASPSTINSALIACPANTYLQLGAGTFYLNAGIVIQAPTKNVALRGMGADQTFLVFSGNNSCMGFYSDICVESSDLNWKGGPSNLANWTAGYSPGATTITLASVPNLKVGNPIILDQADDTSDNGSVLVCDYNGTSGEPAGLICSSQQNGGGSQRTHRNQAQIVTVTGCGSVTSVGASCSGSNVSVKISPGLYMPNWNSNSVSGGPAPQAWWPSGPVENVGIEDLSQDDSAVKNTIGIEVFNCLNCWVRGIRGIESTRAHVEIQMSQHVTVRDSYFFLTADSTSTSYGVECYSGSDLLIENNIFHGVASPEMMNGACEGTVIGYNFNILNYYTSASGYALAPTNAHTAGTDFMLWEGNSLNQVYADEFHGTHNFDTMFRNYDPGTLPACWINGSSYSNSTYGECTGNLSAAVFQSKARFFNVIGNVLGTTGVQHAYEAYAGGAATSGNPIYQLGFGDTDPMTSVTVPNDTNVRLTLMRWGNYDTVDAANRFVSSEVPSSLSGVQAAYSNPVPVSNNLPPSFYYASAPSWWPSGKAWPPIGPDVTGGNISGVGGHANTIPAQDCYSNVMGGSLTGAGPVLNFNTHACYGTSVVVGPNPPTGLTAVSQ